MQTKWQVQVCQGVKQMCVTSIWNVKWRWLYLLGEKINFIYNWFVNKTNFATLNMELEDGFDDMLAEISEPTSPKQPKLDAPGDNHIFLN